MRSLATDSRDWTTTREAAGPLPDKLLTQPGGQECLFISTSEKEIKV